MKNLLTKILLTLLILAIPFGFAACGEDESKETDTEAVDFAYDVDDEEGWSPIWRP